jgi:hypothetical protein
MIKTINPHHIPYFSSRSTLDEDFIPPTPLSRKQKFWNYTRQGMGIGGVLLSPLTYLWDVYTFRKEHPDNEDAWRQFSEEALQQREAIDSLSHAGLPMDSIFQIVEPFTMSDLPPTEPSMIFPAILTGLSALLWRAGRKANQDHNKAVKAHQDYIA